VAIMPAEATVEAMVAEVAQWVAAKRRQGPGRTLIGEG